MSPDKRGATEALLHPSRAETALLPVAGEGNMEKETPENLKGLISSYSARLHRILPVALERTTVILLSDIPLTPERQKMLGFHLGRPVLSAPDGEFLAQRNRFQELLDEYCGSVGSLEGCDACSCIPPAVEEEKLGESVDHVPG
jgi:hypothetical protein